MTHLFETCSGSVAGVGAHHLQAGANNQDASCILSTPEATVAVVCDGCSSSEKSTSVNEIGALVGARLLAKTLHDQVKWHGKVDWRQAEALVLSDLQTMLHFLRGHDERQAAVCKYLLFTSLVVVITPDLTEVAAVGDGVVFLNGKRLALKPVAGNAPDYLAYSLLQVERVGFEVVAEIPTSELSSFVLACDGAEPLVEPGARTYPGTMRDVGPFSQLWEEDRFFENSDQMRRHLVLCQGGTWKKTAGDRPSFWRAPGLLDDDTTIIAGRRRKVKTEGLVTT